MEDPEAFRSDLSRVLAGLPDAPEARARLASAIVTSARPDAAARILCDCMEDADAPLDPSGPGLAAVARVFGGADFLARRAARLRLLVDDVCGDALLAPRSEAEAFARLPADRALPVEEARRTLRRNRYAEMFRITARALAGAPAAETTREISDLADASISAALRATEAAHGVEGQLTAIAMGKLGGRELNYSSDVDLIFAHHDPGERAVPHAQLARAVVGLRSVLSEIDAEGFVFRVDLDLRPEGRTGAPVTPASSLVGFYESFGRTWERVAWIRARPCAGDRALGERIIADLVPFVFRRYGSYDVVQNVRDVKQRIQADAHNAEANVKLGPGGIREAEFVVQALQSLWGGRHEELRTPNTSDALRALSEHELLEAGQAETLTADYAFLRRVENGLQMAEDRQVQELPDNPDGQRRLARRLGYDDPDGEAARAALLRDLGAVRGRVREAFDSLLVDERVRVGSRAPDAGAWLEACQTPAAFVASVVAAAPPELADRCAPGAQRLAEASFGRGGEGAAALEQTPEAAPALALFLAAEPELVNHLVQHPRLLESFAGDPDAALPEPDAIDPKSDLETALDAMRLARRDAFVHVAARRLRGQLDETGLQQALSHTAETILAAGLAIAREHAPGRPGAPDPARLCILGLGKLGSQEMTFHSDLDLVFLYEPREGEAALAAQEWASRLAQKLIHYLTTPTSAGRAYEVDMRLRPSGHGGALVASLEAFQHYHERRAQIWEAQALLRARPVAGDAEFGARVHQTVQSALFEFLKYPDLQAEIVRMRERIESELGRAGPERLDLKNGAGGMVDAEFLAQFLALREGPRRPELRSGTTPAVLEAAGRLGLLRDAGDALGALETLRRVETSLRLALGRGEATLDLTGPTAPLVAALTGAQDVDALCESVRAAQARLRVIFARELRF